MFRNYLSFYSVLFLALSQLVLSACSPMKVQQSKSQALKLGGEIRSVSTADRCSAEVALEYIETSIAYFQTAKQNFPLVAGRAEQCLGVITLQTHAIKSAADTLGKSICEFETALQRLAIGAVQQCVEDIEADLKRAQNPTAGDYRPSLSISADMLGSEVTIHGSIQAMHVIDKRINVLNPANLWNAYLIYDGPAQGSISLGNLAGDFSFPIDTSGAPRGTYTGHICGDWWFQLGNEVHVLPGQCTGSLSVSLPTFN